MLRNTRVASTKGKSDYGVKAPDPDWFVLAPELPVPDEPLPRLDPEDPDDPLLELLPDWLPPLELDPEP